MQEGTSGIVKTRRRGQVLVIPPVGTIIQADPPLVQTTGRCHYSTRS